jgi:hypothetical protein
VYSGYNDGYNHGYIGELTKWNRYLLQYCRQ